MSKVNLSAYRIMWLFVMFDLPVITATERKEATKFREGLLDLGFEMSQYSVYLKYCPSKEKADSISKRVANQLPYGGKVDILAITDKQFSTMQHFIGHKKLRKKKRKAGQLFIF